LSDIVSRDISTKSASLAARTIRFIGSNEALDRDGDTISVAGWDVSSYLQNPIVLYGHDPSSLPIAKTTNLVIDTRAKQLIFDVTFPSIEEMSSNPKTPSEHALRVDAIYNMAKAGILNAVSVGFKGEDYEPTATGRKYNRQKLYELSIVPIPSNPEAVAIMRSAGIADLTIKGLNMDIETKSGARLSAASKERIAKIRAKCNDLIKDMDDFEKGVDNEPNVNEEETANGTESKPTPKAAKADDIVFTLVEKASPAQGE
jgi:hypothetical protein